MVSIFINSVILKFKIQRWQFFVSILFCFFAIPSSGQQNYFLTISDMDYPSGRSGHSVVELADGTFIVVGWAHFFYNSPLRQETQTFSKFGANGTLLLDTIYSQSEYIRRSNGMSMVDGTSLITVGANVDTLGAKYDAYVSKIDTNANIIWQKIIGDPLLNNDGNAVLKTYDSGYIIAGSEEASGMLSDGNIVKLDSVGTVLWDTSYGANGSDFFFDVKESSDSGLVFVGTKYLNAGLGYFWILKTDRNGSFLWEKTFDFDTNEQVRSFLFMDDGGYLLAGSGAFDAWLIRLDQNRDTVWTMRPTYGLPYSSFINKVRKCRDGNYVAVGGWNWSEPEGDYNTYILKFNDQGKILWQRTVEIDDSLYNDYAYDVIQTQDGGFAITGRTETPDTLIGTNLYLGAGQFLLKTNCAGFWQAPIAQYDIVSTVGNLRTFRNTSLNVDTCMFDFGDGNELWTKVDPLQLIQHTYSNHPDNYTATVHPFVSCDTSTFIYQGIKSNPLLENFVRVFPNPARSAFSVKLAGKENESHRFTLLDVLGREIFHQSMKGNSERSFNIGQSPGMYFWIVESLNKEWRQSGKIVFE